MGDEKITVRMDLSSWGQMTRDLEKFYGVDIEETEVGASVEIQDAEAEATDEAEEVKDVAHYASLAEEWLAEADRVRPVFPAADREKARFEHAMMAADVYGRLALAMSLVPTDVFGSEEDSA